MHADVGGYTTPVGPEGGTGDNASMRFGTIAATLAIVVAGLAAPAEAQTFSGKASYYGGGGRTASGGHVGRMTCAHRSLPFGSRVRVTNLMNHRSAVLVVNDRGPFVGGRVLDVSTGAARILGFIGRGIAAVRVSTL